MLQGHAGSLVPHDQIAGFGVDRSASEARRPSGAVECAEQAEVDVFVGRVRLLRCATDRP